MCYKQQYHYTLCDHWIRQSSACLERNENDCTCENVSEAHYNDRCRSCIAHTNDLPKALQHLRLKNRFDPSTAGTDAPSFSPVQYDTTQTISADDGSEDALLVFEAQDDDSTDCEIPRNAFQLPDTPPVSPTCSSDQHSSQHAYMRHSHEVLEPSDTALRTRPGGFNQSGCGKQENLGHVTKKPREDKIRLTQYRCKYGDHRVLDQLGDRLSLEVCVWHDRHGSVEDQKRRCLILQVDGTYG